MVVRRRPPSGAGMGDPHPGRFGGSGFVRETPPPCSGWCVQGQERPEKSTRGWASGVPSRRGALLPNPGENLGEPCGRLQRRRHGGRRLRHGLQPPAGDLLRKFILQVRVAFPSMYPKLGEALSLAALPPSGAPGCGSSFTNARWEPRAWRGASAFRANGGRLWRGPLLTAYHSLPRSS
jgi:hypothetical protein